MRLKADILYLFERQAGAGPADCIPWGWLQGHNSSLPGNARTLGHLDFLTGYLSHLLRNGEVTAMGILSMWDKQGLGHL